MSIEKPRDVQARDVQAIYISADTLALRSRSWNRLRFEVEYALEKGTTANSFLIQDQALIDPPGGTFTEIYLAELRQRTNLNNLRYVILGHVNKNRVITLQSLLDANPKLTFICTNPGAVALKALIPDREIQIQVVRGEEYLDLGKGHGLKFFPVSTPRYPDGLWTYDSNTQILYTDKFFSAHVCGDQVFDESPTLLFQDRRYYFDCVMANQTRQVEAALDKLIMGTGVELPVSFYAPAHGPMLKYGAHELVKSYRQWCEDQQKQNISVALIYASAYGNTATLAHALARGITKAGVAVELINCEHAEPDDIKAAVEKASGFLIGSPTLAGHLPTQVQTALGIVISTANKNYLAGVFGSYGWSGEAVDIIADKLKDAGYTIAFEPIRTKFTPTEATLQICQETGVDFAQNLKSLKKVRTTLASGSSIEQAVGRVVGSLCVVTVQQEEISSAMLASWVAQATFNPPGITVAVAKERAIEAYLHEGSQFVLNILEQGKQLRRSFMKRFAPGENRFADVETQESDYGLILTDSLAYLECRVAKRMECGDHWLVYAITESGKLLEPNGLTAVHHRKSGAHY